MKELILIGKNIYTRRYVEKLSLFNDNLFMREFKSSIELNNGLDKWKSL